MKRVLLSTARGVRSALVGVVALLGTGAILAVGANYTMTQGSGTTFGSLVVSAVNYVQMLVCDPATPSQCAAVSAGGAVKVDGSAVTQPISAASLPLPASAATSTKQPALGTAGTASSDVLTMQGIAGMTPLLANPGTPANWGLGAFGAAMVANGQAIGFYDGTNMVRAKGDETNGIWVNIKAGAGSGGTALADEAAFTQGTTNTTPAGCLYTTSVTNLTTGQAGAVRCTNDRQAMVSDSALLAAAEAGTAANGSTYPPSSIGIGSMDGSGHIQPASTANPIPVMVPASQLVPTAAGINQTFPAGWTATGCQFATIANSANNGSPLSCDSDGRLITVPWATKASWVTGQGSTNGTGATTVIGATAGLKNYITQVRCGRTDAGTTAIAVAFNTGGGQGLVIPNNGGGGGNNATYNPPMATAVNTAFTFAPGTATTTVFCSADGFLGP